jgi:4-amino-4-deoxy-L-arabinose transferase-like glycosyltransferase
LRSGADRLPLLLAVAYLAAALAGLGGADLVGDDEAREAGLVREIVAGTPFLPRFNGEVLPDKPLLFHWLAAIPCRAGGFSEACVRLPSAFAGASLVASTASLGTAMFGRPAGVAAAVVLATMPALFTRVRVARPDVLLVLLLALALGAAFRWWQTGRRRDATASLALVGAATLAKGPVAPVLFALTLGGFLAWQGELRRGRGLATAPGIAAFAILGLGWYVIALAGWGTLFVHEHLVGRYVFNLLGDLPAGGGYSARSAGFHLGYYATHLPIVALPWTPFLAVALWRAWRGRPLAPAVRFLCCWALAPAIAFTPAQYKLRHYLLPALPALALLAAPAVVDAWRTVPRRLGARGAAAAALAAGVASALAALVARRGLGWLSTSDRSTLDGLAAAVPGGMEALTVGVATLAGLAVIAVARRAWAAFVGALAVGMAVALAVGTPALERSLSRRDSLKTFARGVAALVPPGAPLVLYRLELRPLVVYLDRHLPRIQHRRDLPPGVHVLAEASVHARLAAAGLAGPALLVGDGRLGNVGRGRVVLARTAPGRHDRAGPSYLWLLPALEREGAAVDLAAREAGAAGQLGRELAEAPAGGAAGAQLGVERGHVDGRRSARRCTGDDDGHLAAHGVARRRGPERREAAAVDLLVPFRQLAADGRLAVAERGFGGGEEEAEPAPGLEEDERARLGGERGEAGRARRRTVGEEPLEDEAVGGDAGHGDERHRGRRPGDRHHRDAGVDGAAHEVIPGIGDAGRAGVADEGDARAGREPRDDGGRARPLDRVVVARERAGDAVVREQRARVPGVLRRDQVDLAEDAQRPQRHVLEVPDRRGDDVEDAARHADASLPTPGRRARRRARARAAS